MDKNSTTESGFTLLERATAACGSRYKVAQAIDEDLSFLGKIAKGKAALSPGIAAKLAEVAGLDPRDAALAAIVSQEKDPNERERMARLFGMPAKVAACVVAALIAFPGNDAAAAPNGYSTDRLCIMSTNKWAYMVRLLARILARLQSRQRPYQAARLA